MSVNHLVAPHTVAKLILPMQSVLHLVGQAMIILKRSIVSSVQHLNEKMGVARPLPTQQPALNISSQPAVNICLGSTCSIMRSMVGLLRAPNWKLGRSLMAGKPVHSSGASTLAVGSSSRTGRRDTWIRVKVIKRR